MSDAEGNTIVTDTVSQSPQYAPSSVHRYEVIFGQDFVSSGGLETTELFCKTLPIQKGTRVLDVGCGLGGSAFYMSRTYGAHVTGVDIQAEMIHGATQRATERGTKHVRFIQGDILEMDLDERAYDLAYSRDAFLHIEDKATLFKRLHSCLAPGGQLFITDYATGPAPLTDEFTNYVADTGYFLSELPEYGSLIEQAGFAEVVVVDESDRLRETLYKEIDKIKTSPADLTQEDIEYLVKRWELKIRCLKRGDMKWGSFRATAK